MIDTWKKISQSSLQKLEEKVSPINFIKSKISQLLMRLNYVRALYSFLLFVSPAGQSPSQLNYLSFFLS